MKIRIVRKSNKDKSTMYNKIKNTSAEYTYNT